MTISILKGPAAPGAATRAAVERIDAWLFGGLLPVWQSAGWDGVHGGVHERLDTDLSPVPLGRKRLVVQFRNLYQAAHAGILTGERGEGPQAAFARRLFDWILDHGWDRTHGGWYFSLTPEGEPLDPTKDAYAHAFALFAFAWYLRATGDGRAADWAARTADLLEGPFRDAANGGCFDTTDPDWTPRLGLKRQNPHMHALEGYLALAETTGDGRYAAEAGRLVDLALARFIDGGSRLREFFTDDWSLSPATGHVIEPGHHYEWVWLLNEAERLLGRRDCAAAAAGLFGWAERHGLAPSGRIYDAVDPDGAPLDGKSRCWPACERLKALVARRDGPGAAQALDHLFTRFLQPDGRWTEHWADDHAVFMADMPGSTGYHIMLALTEYRRFLLGS